ncbi:MAG: TetR/AcrR family transcriptional regulator [Mycobacterium sp.]|nr:TetR/AcrR family transcriptional regulator [Mycobacterium sp.]
MPAQTPGQNRTLGRPPGGGKSSQEAREALLDAAERSLVARGYRASTMAAIAQEAGCTRTIIYRHFATRDELLVALVTRATGRHIATIFEHFDGGDDLATMITEALVVVATELARDPIFAVLAEQSEHVSAADFFAGATSLNAIVEALITAQLDTGKGGLRRGLRPSDAAHHLVVSAVGLLRGVVPGSGDPNLVRRYVRVLVLPALLQDPPLPEAVFPPL